MSNDPHFPESNSAPLSTNPYAPTSHVSDADVVAMEDVVAYRKTHLNHETSVKSIGFLYLLGAVIMIPTGLWLATGGFGNSDDFVSGLLYIVFGVCEAIVGIGLRRLKNWARIGSILFSVIGLIAIPVGTLMSAYFLYLLLSEKGRIVFSESYQRIIEQTPEVRYKTSIVVWFFLGLLVVFFLLGISAMLFVA